ncbi:MAG TPA: hypothetical protein VLS51_03790 [Propionibacteriaceae bacterium]|nr:hypothetical protein [Propionibacteriaceae bacterium]
MKDPNGRLWMAHPEDEGHWRHWDNWDPPRGPKTRWPEKSLKPHKTQKRKPYGDQCGTDPNGDEPEWKPPSPLNPFMFAPEFPLPIELPFSVPVFVW